MFNYASSPVRRVRGVQPRRRGRRRGGRRAQIVTLYPGVCTRIAFQISRNDQDNIRHPPRIPPTSGRRNRPESRRFDHLEVVESDDSGDS